MKDCLDSVISQSFKDFEIVVCDDHSTDGTYDILLQYQSESDNIRVLRNSKNMGVTPARHRAIMESRGKYITTLDHDDIYISKDKLLNEITLTRDHKQRSNKDVCAFSEIYIINEYNEIVQPQWDPSLIAQGNIFNKIISRSTMIPRDFIFLREDYFRVGGFDPKLKLYEDWDLKIRLANIREFYYTGSPGTGYRRINFGHSYSFTPHEHLKSLKEVFRKNVNLIAGEEKAFCENAFSSYLSERKSKGIKRLQRAIVKHINNLKPEKVMFYLFQMAQLHLLNTRVK